MEKTLAELARGEATLPLRSILWLPERVGALGLMPAALLKSGVLGVKAITFFNGNEGTELDTHQGAVLLFEA
ncbi:MAG TPA: ornithine cyclodeaminase family protein, partial [Thermoanaerobaculia bacterium]|nr:ornithine cyclodeaminase family protein [Thermoanaerobaculia bacterium]